MHKKKGDTLIEVALAIGIFSLVAIVVVSVVSASTSSAQAALELTITREELDSQAEALRFIHDSFVIGSQSMDTSKNPYTELWQAIASRAIEPKDENISYIPTTCSELYDADGFMNAGIRDQHPFVINARQLNTLDPAKIIVDYDSNIAQGHFYEAATYPRILYGDILTSDSRGLYDQDERIEDEIQRVEGIYITAVEGLSDIVSNTPSDEGIDVEIGSKIAYYDFYIHSCWMPPGSERASTISTVIRLYDPAVIYYGPETP